MSRLDKPGKTGMDFVSLTDGKDLTLLLSPTMATPGDTPHQSVSGSGPANRTVRVVTAADVTVPTLPNDIVNRVREAPAPLNRGADILDPATVNWSNMSYRTNAGHMMARMEFDGLAGTCLPHHEDYPFGFGYYQFITDTISIYQDDEYEFVVCLDGVLFSRAAFERLLVVFADEITRHDPLHSRDVTADDDDLPDDIVYFPTNVGPDRERFREFWGLPCFGSPSQWTLADYRLLMLISRGGSPLRRLHDFTAYRSLDMIEPQGYRGEPSDRLLIQAHRSPTRCSRRVRRQRARLHRAQYESDDLGAARAAWREDAIYPIEPQGFLGGSMDGMVAELSKLNQTFDANTVDRVCRLVNSSTIRMQASAEKISKAVDNCVDKVTNGGMHRPFEREVENVCRSIDNTTATVADIASSLNWPARIMEWVGENSSELGLMVCLCIVAYGVRNHSNGTSSWPIISAATACAIIFAKRCNDKHECMGRLIDFLVRNVSRGAEIEQQGFQDILPELFSYVTVFAIPILDCKEAERKVSELVKKQSQVPRVMDSLKGLVDFGVKVIDEIIKWIASYSGKTPFSLAEWLKPECKRIAEWIEKAESTLETARSVRGNQEQLAEWPIWVDHLHRLRKEAGDVRLDVSQDRNLTAFLRQVDTIAQQCNVWIAAFEEAIPKGTGTRMVPATALFSGKAGIGKTFMVERFMEAIMCKIYGLDPETEAASRLMKDYTQNKSRHVYVKPNGKFWSQYMSQPITLMDEVLQRTQGPVVEGEDCECMNFLEMVNSRPWPVNMNENADKGKVMFNSRAIIGTTNASSPTAFIRGINEAAAYVRRWDMFVDVTLNRDYALENGMLDSKKLERAIDNDPDLEYTFPHLSFTMYKELKKQDVVTMEGFNGGQPLVSVPFQTILDIYFDHYDRKSRAYRRLVTSQTSEVHPALKFLSKNRIQAQSPCTLCVEAIEMPWVYPALMVNQFAQKAFEGYQGDFMVQMHVKPFLEQHFWNGYLKGVYTFAGKVPERLCFCHVLEPYVDGTKSPYAFNMGVEELGRVCGKYSMRDIGNLLYDNVVSFFREQWTVIVRAAAGFCVGYMTAMLVGKALRYFFGGEDKEYTKTAGVIMPQMSDRNAQEIGHCIIRRSLMCMQYDDGNGTLTDLGNVLFLVDRVALMPQHYLHHLDKLCESNETKGNLVLHRLGMARHAQKVQIPLKDFVANMDMFIKPYGPDTDLVCALFPKAKCIAMPDIRRYLVDDARSKSGYALAYRARDEEGRIDEYECPWEEYGDNETYPDINEKNQRYVLNKHFVYKCTNAPGDCGMPIMLMNTATRCQKLLGMHVAGRGQSTSYGVRIDTVLYDQCMAHYEAQGVFMIKGQGPVSMDPTQLFDVGNKLSFDDLPDVPPSRRIEGKLNLGMLESVPNISKSAICRSPIYKKIGYEPQTRPARLHPFLEDGVVIDPAIEATKKYSIPLKPFDSVLLEKCAKAYSNSILNAKVQYETPADHKVLSYEIAVKGMERVDGINGIPRSTSAGYPWNLMFKTDLKGKQIFFGVEGEYEFGSHEERVLFDMVMKLEAAAKQGIRMAIVFRDFNKDERRLLDKVIKGKTRKISGAPVHWAILVRMYYGAHVDWYMGNRIRNGSAVGINPYSHEWTELVNHLGRNRRVIAGDFSNYDGHLPYELMKQFLDHVCAWYGKDSVEANHVREVLFEDVCNSRHILNGVIYEWIGSNSSGNPLTTILNTFCNNVLLIYATVMIVLQHDPDVNVNELLRDLSNLVRFMCYGDDNLIAVNRDHKYGSLLTQESYTMIFSEIGLTYTDESKGSTMFADRDIGECTFLKRGFEKNYADKTHRDWWCAPLALTTILESVQWTKHKDVSYDDWRDNVQNMLFELSLHKKDVFDEWAPRIISACRECEVPYTPVYDEYVACQRIMVERQYNVMW